MRYGVITTGRTCYLCRVDDQGLQVSQPISWDSEYPPLLAAVSFIMTHAMRDRDNSKLVFTSGQRGACGALDNEVQLKLSAKLMVQPSPTVGLWLNEQTEVSSLVDNCAAWWSKPLPASLTALCCVHFMSNNMLQDLSQGAAAPHHPALTMKRQAVGIGRDHSRAQHHVEVLAQCAAPTGLALFFVVWHAHRGSRLSHQGQQRLAAAVLWVTLDLASTLSLCLQARQQQPAERKWL